METKPTAGELLKEARDLLADCKSDGLSGLSTGTLEAISKTMARIDAYLSTPSGSAEGSSKTPSTPTRGTPGVQPLLAEYMASHTLYDATLNYEGYSFTYVVEGTQGDFIILNLEPVLRLTKPLHKSPPVTYFKDKLDILTDLGLFARGDYTDLAYTLIEQDYFSSDPPESDD